MEDGSPCFSSTAIHWHQWPTARCCVLEPHDDKGNDGINYMYLSLSLPLSLSLSLSLSLFPPSISACLSVCLTVCLSLGNKPTETYSESKKTHASVTLAGACEVINSRVGSVEPTASRPSDVICNVVSDIKTIYKNKVDLSSR